MKGIVFAEFLDMVERRHGLEVVDAIIEAAAPASGGAYTAVGVYDWRELVQLATALAALRGARLENVLRDYGRALFGVFVQRFPMFFVGPTSPLDFLASVEGIIHPEVTKLYPDCELPRFDVERSPRQIVMRYSSQRPLGDFARGLIDGCVEHFAVPCAVTADGAGGRWTFTVRMQEVPCPSAR